MVGFEIRLAIIKHVYVVNSMQLRPLITQHALSEIVDERGPRVAMLHNLHSLSASRCEISNWGSSGVHIPKVFVDQHTYLA